MISRLVLNKVASFKQSTVLETDKRVNLIYGLNGTGKSTISQYLYDCSNERFSNCSHDAGDNVEIVVYNEQFVEDTFYQAKNDLPGIFTLSKENKEARTAIDNAIQELSQLRADLADKQVAFNTATTAKANALHEAREAVWQIKIKCSGGDRVLDFCLEGYKIKDKLFAKISAEPKQKEKPNRSIQELEAELKSVTGVDATPLSPLTKILFAEQAIETDQIFLEPIIGSADSAVAALIEMLQNSDWVRQGLQYLPEQITSENSQCPFCQESTISAEFLDKLRKYFDETFERQLARLSSHSDEYSESIQELPVLTTYLSHPSIQSTSDVFKAKYNELFAVLDANRRAIQEKVANPSKVINLTNTSKKLTELNMLIEEANKKVRLHNQKIADTAGVKRAAKDEFWQIMRWDYDPIFETYMVSTAACEKEISATQKAVATVQAAIEEKETLIAEKQKATVNVDQAVQQINATLAELGMDDFSIVKKKDSDLYRLIREDQDESIFMTLSEGEKMMISFLYFLELCRGKSSATAIPRKKIVVIDDPISSLSHIFVFNVGRLIHAEFLRSEAYEQVFVLTHSLYFFYELTDTNHERREKTQKLFRLLKNRDGSQILPMHYDEIQNDYHTYWAVIKDDRHPPALIANCMRNVIEYFFGFVEKRDVNNVFQKPELKPVRFQAFCRYINRESHSLPQNIFDQKEFDYNDFKEAFELVFKLTHYENHYAKMMR